eukprot:gene3893-2254_t
MEEADRLLEEGEAARGSLSEERAELSRERDGARAERDGLRAELSAASAASAAAGLEHEEELRRLRGELAGAERRLAEEAGPRARDDKRRGTRCWPARACALGMLARIA